MAALSIDRIAPWAVRIAWGALALSAGPVFAAALDERSGAVQRVASVGLWATWALVLCASLILHPIAVTIVRVASPAAVVAVVAAAIAGGPSRSDVVIALVTSAIATLAAYLPETVAAFVNGPAYPNERRFPLRPPGPLLLGPLVLAWAATTVLPVLGLLLLATGQWVAGGIVTAGGVAAVIVLGRAVHGLSRRWIVFVPAGVVLHDPITLADPVLVRRQDIGTLGPAAADTEALDLTAKAFGLALELTVPQSITLALVQPGSTTAKGIHAFAVIFTPTRPGAVLAEARRRHLG